MKIKNLHPPKYMEKGIHEVIFSPVTGFSHEELEGIPSRTGVYIMKDERGQVLYVGKAKDLNSRVRSYFTGQNDQRPAIPYLLERVKSIDTIITDTEKEALILENTLIKKYRPRYNVNFRDDKNYFSLRVDLNSPFPRLHLVRKVKKDGAMYFGPYVSSSAVKETLKVIHEHFPLRTCRDAQFFHRSRPCLNFEIGRCSAPCTGNIEVNEYRRLVDGAILFLRGKNKELISALRKQMREASCELRFEEAARIRDRISAIESTIEGQKVVNYRRGDVDIHAWQVSDGKMGIQILHVREGKLMDSRPFVFSIKSLQPEEAFSSFFKQYYSQNRQIPDEILVPNVMEESDAIETWLSDERGKRVKIRVPLRGEGRRLMEMASENAMNLLRDRQKKEEEMDYILASLRKRTGLRKSPRTIECIDISNISGKEAVGSVVRFEDGKPEKEAYRHYRIKTVEGADDYAMMYEVLRRHLKRRMEASLLPDLILADGGKGHLRVVLEVLKELKVDETDAIAIAKLRIRKGKRGEATRDRIYVPHIKDPVDIPMGSPELLLLQRIRDEAHRFGLAYHRRLRGKRGSDSILDRITGIGKARKLALLKHFGGLKAINEASLEDLMEVSGISKKLARHIYINLHSPSKVHDS